MYIGGKVFGDDVDMENIVIIDVIGLGFVVVIVCIFDLMYGCYIWIVVIN